MSAPDHGTDELTPTAFPAPHAGAGSADLATDSTDPQELRALLERARERLSFYESFDRIIAENMRHTGEMMAETVSLREQAALEVRKRKEADKAVEAERERYRALLEGALSEVRTAQPVIEAMVARLQGALAELSGDAHVPSAAEVPLVAEVETTSEPERLTPDVPTVATPASDAAEPARDVAPAAPEPVATPQETAASATEPSPAAEIPSTLEILAHNVPSAATAIGLQQMLREIDTIERVEAREFADGELRLHLECRGEIPDAHFTDWLSHNSGSLVSRNAKAIELTFG